MYVSLEEVHAQVVTSDVVNPSHTEIVLASGAHSPHGTHKCSSVEK